MQYTHEILMDRQDCWLMLRPSVAHQLAYRVELPSGAYHQMTPTALLDCRDRTVNGENADTFEINLEPFFNPELTIRDPRNIGQGLQFPHQFLLDKHVHNVQEWEETLFQILHQCRYQTHSFLIGADIHSLFQLKATLAPVFQVLEHYQDEDSATVIEPAFRALGLEPGWGNTVGRCRATLKLLEWVIQCPDASTLEAFLGKVPNIFSVVSVSGQRF